MRIGLDVRKMYDSGIGTYVRNLLTHLPALAGDDDTFALIASPAQRERALAEFPNPRFEWLYNVAGKYSFAELSSIARQASGAGVDLFHSPHYNYPFGLRMPGIATVHDLIPLRFPKQFGPAKRLYARTMIGHACKSARLVITGSHHAKGDLIKEFGIDESRVRVIYHGVPSEFGVTTPREVESFRARYDLTRPYAFFASNFKPHKNLPLLLRAFAAIPASTLPDLVLVGGEIGRHSDLRQLVADLKIDDRVKLPGKLSQPDLVCAYHAALMVVFPSLYEGFGFPALEAMACGTPLVASNASSLPEVVGDAGILFDPTDAAALTNAMIRVATDENLRESLHVSGLRRVLEFPVDRCARETLQAYREVAS